MKRIIFILALILCSRQAWGATKYMMRSDGTATIKTAATTTKTMADACPLSTPSTAMSITVHNSQSYAAGDTFYLCSTGGSYTWPKLTASTNGSVPSPITYQGDSNTIFDGSGLSDDLFYTSFHTNIVIDGITFQNSQTNYYGLKLGNGTTGTGIVAQNCKFKNNWRHLLLGTNTPSYITVQKNEFIGWGTQHLGQDIFISTSTGTVNFFDNISHPMPISGGDTNWGFGATMQIQGTGEYNVYNNLFAGTRVPAITIFGTPASGTLTEKNNTFLGCSADNIVGTATIIGASTGETFDAENNYIATSAIIPGNPISNGDTTANNIFYGAYNHKKASRKGYLLFSTDDFALGANPTWAYLYGTDGTDGIIAEFQKRNMHLTWYVNTYLWPSISGYATDILWAKNNGVEIGLHGYSNTDLRVTSALTVTSTNTSPTLKVDRIASKLTLYSVEDGTITIPTVGTFQTTTIGAIITAIASHATWTATLADSKLDINAYGEVLQGDSVAQAVPRTILIDRTTGTNPATGIFKAELADPLAQIEAIVGVGTVHSYAYPQGGQDATAQLAVRQLRNGQITSARVTALDSASSQYLSFLNRYLISDYNTTDTKTDIGQSYDTATNMKANINGLMAFLSELGAITNIVSHNATNFSKAEFITALDTALAWQDKVRVFYDSQTAMSEIMSESTDNGDGTLTRAWTDNSDYSLRASSPAIDKGLNVGVTSDYLGKTVPNPITAATDIGAYEYYGTNQIVYGRDGFGLKVYGRYSNGIGVYGRMSLGTTVYGRDNKGMLVY